MDKLSAFRRTVVDISHALSDHDLEKIIYIFGIPEQDTKRRSLPVLKQLERDGHFSAAKPEGLEKLLEDIHRSDLNSHIQDYYSQFRYSRCCCQCTSFKHRVTKLAELCLAQADSTNQRLKDMQRDLERFSNNHRKTPTTEKFCRQMEEKFKSAQNDFSRYHTSPLHDLQKLVATGANTAVEADNKVQEVASDRVKPTNSLSQPILDQLDGSMEDYDSLEPNGSQDKFGGRPLTATTRIPIPIRKTSGHSSLLGSSPVLNRRRRPGESPQRGRSRDYESASLTSSTEDSGFSELRSLHVHHSSGHLGSSRHRNDSLPHAWRESRVYTSLDLATADKQSEYVDINKPNRSRRQKK